MHEIKEKMHAHQEKKHATEGTDDNVYCGVQVHSKEHIDNIGTAAGAQGNAEVPLMVTDQHGKAAYGVGEVPVLSVRGLDGANIGAAGTGVTDTGAMGSQGRDHVGATGQPRIN